MLAHAQRQRFGAAQCQPAVEWTRDGARRILDKAEPFGDIVAPGDEHAADHIRVPVQVLRRRVQNDVGAELERLLEVRRGEGVVDDEQRPRLAGDRASRGEVAQAHHRIRRGLGVNDLGVGRDGSRHGLRIATVHEGECDSHPRPDMSHLPMRAAVHVLAAHDVIAGRQQLHHGVERREPRAEGESMMTTFECRDVAFECLARRITRARVLVALVAPQPILHVRRGLIDRLHHGAA